MSFEVSKAGFNNQLCDFTDTRPPCTRRFLSEAQSTDCGIGGKDPQSNVTNTRKKGKCLTLGCEFTRMLQNHRRSCSGKSLACCSKLLGGKPGGWPVEQTNYGAATQCCQVLLVWPVIGLEVSLTARDCEVTGFQAHVLTLSQLDQKELFLCSYLEKIPREDFDWTILGHMSIP